MAITNTILLKGLLGAVVCLGSASAAIANRGKIVSYFSKDKKANGVDSKKPKGDGKAQNEESTTHSDKGATESSPSATPNGVGTDDGKTANEGQGSNAPSGTAGGAGANPGQAGQSQPVPSNPDSGADTTTGQGSKGVQSQPGTSGPSPSAQTNTDNNEINKKITDTLKLPEDCKFDGNEKDNTKECTITKDKLAKVSFVNKDDSKDLTIDESFTNLKLEIRKFNKPTEDEKKRYGNSIGDNDLWFTFKNLTTNITIKGKNNQDITLKKGTSPEFSIYSEKLTKAWYPSSLGFKVGLKCEDSSSTKECTLLAATNSSKTINFFSDDSSEIKKISVGDSDKSKKITLAKDQENYNQGFKFTVPEGGISASSGSDSLKAGDYEIKYLNNKGWGLSKKENAQAQ